MLLLIFTALSFKYQIPLSELSCSLFGGSSVTVNAITLFLLQPQWQAHSYPEPYLYFRPLLYHKDPFRRAYSCIRFPHVAHDCLGKGIFCFNLAFSQGGTKGTSFLELASLGKLFRIASFLSRLTDAYNPSLSAIVQHNFFIILCPFHLENPSPIKVIQPPNTCSQLNLSCTTCPDAAGHRFLPLIRIH